MLFRSAPNIIVSIHSLHLRREKLIISGNPTLNLKCFNPLSSFTKREISATKRVTLVISLFQSTLFIYEERNFVNKHLYPRAIKFQSTLFIYEERNTGCFRLHPSRQGFNPLSSFTKREIRISSRSCSYLVCFNPLSSFTKREIA